MIKEHIYCNARLNELKGAKEIKNGGCYMTFNGILLAYIYAVVGTEKDFITLKKGGILYKKYEYELKRALINFVNEDVDFSNAKYIWNDIDSIY